MSEAAEESFNGRESDDDLRTCACGCGEMFMPTNDRHKYKNPNHRKRGWEKRKRHEVARKLARRLLDPETIERHLAEIEEEL